MSDFFSSAKIRRWLRFLMGGGINTGFTYLVYLALNTALSYQISYFIAYIAGIVFSYFFNAIFVFRVPLSLKGAFSYPLVYAVQYILSAFLLGGLIELASIDKSLAPLIVTALMIPLTYVMSKFLLEWKSRSKTP